MELVKNMYNKILIHRYLFFKNKELIKIVFNVYQMKGLFIPPDGISNIELLIISISNRIFIVFFEFSNIK